MKAQEKIRENRLRRKLSRMGYRLEKSRRKDQDAWDFGLYAVVDQQTSGVVNDATPGMYSWTMDDVEAWISEQTAAKAER